MNYVGQLAETVFVTVKELYRGLNPATLTGGIDVIVVRQPDGSLQCSPFHVRFGKLGVLRSKEKVVDIEINGEPVQLHMKLGDNGEAFFVEENEDLESRVPAHLCTSPIPMELPKGSEDTAEVLASVGGSWRRKKRRRKRMRSDTHLWEDGSSSSEEREREREREREQADLESPTKVPTLSILASKSVYYSLAEEPFEVGETQSRDVHPHSDGEWSPSESTVFYSRPSSPKSDSELLVKQQESSRPQMQWSWGGFPKLERTPSEVQRASGSSHFRTIHRQDSFDMDSEATVICGRIDRVIMVRPQPRILSSDSEHPYIERIPFTLDDGPQSFHSSTKDPPTLASLAMGSLDRIQVLEQTWVDYSQTGLKLVKQTPSNLEVEESPNVIGKSVCVVYSENATSLVIEECTDSKDVSRLSDTASITNTAYLAKETQRSNTTSLAKTIRSPSTADLANAASSVNSESLVEQQSALLEPNHQGLTKGVVLTEADRRNEPCTGECNQNKEVAGIDMTTEATLTNQTAESFGVTELANETGGEDRSVEGTLKSEQQDKTKGKRSQHLGPSDIYLDDLSNLNPKVAALYFPKSISQEGFHLSSETEGLPRPGPEQGSTSGTQSPQSVGSGAMDSGTEYLSDSMSDTMDASMSLCGRVSDTSLINKDKFMEHIVTYQDFVNNPGIIDDPNLVICINSKYYNWAVAAPMVLAMQAFQKNLPKNTIEELVKVKMPKKSGRWWFSWRRKDMDANQANSKQSPEEPQTEASCSVSISTTVKATLDDLSSDEEAGLGRQASLSTETMTTAQCISQMYRKSLRLTSEQIERLNLREGANKVVFSVTTQYQGTCRCEAAIYLWNWDDSVVISDIDGTITKSDALGHILPQLGKDWTHHGIAKLYHKIHQNGYKFLYCSARAIGMADITKGYLQWVNDKGTVLPKGPVLLAPSSLFSALHREVIEKKPEVFKIACLTDIRDLFNPQRQPFYAAFGNRTNDAYAYKQVGVADTRIFTVNPRGELIQENTRGNKSSYAQLSELVEHFFPVVHTEGSSCSFDCPEFSHFSFWRAPLPPLDLSSLL
ncbi:phosphatidate phosphatase LPIN2-like isoform X1 [Osmerus mordax]|uniref:phosphatidate phosphatase LPIN2-like isoform X1 n=1 Tax=Osmerus mordax TaxID=8014 RepID=UPI00350EB2F0